VTVNPSLHGRWQSSHVLARFDQWGHGHWRDLGCAAVGLVTNLLAYWPVLSYNFFWEDSFDIGQVER
jgi:hypothetical protein